MKLKLPKTTWSRLIITRRLTKVQSSFDRDLAHLGPKQSKIMLKPELQGLFWEKTKNLGLFEIHKLQIFGGPYQTQPMNKPHQKGHPRLPYKFVSLDSSYGGPCGVHKHSSTRCQGRPVLLNFHFFSEFS